MNRNPTFDDILSHNPKLGRFYTKDFDTFTRQCNESTGKNLKALWLDNVKVNIESGRFDKFGLVKHVCEGFGLNKAMICIGAGPSFNKNKKFLAELCYWNAQYDFKYQPFLFMASNHMFKPCLDMGIIPHFVVLADASEVVYDQLCKDIPRRGHNTVLMAALRTHPKVLEKWEKQGRRIVFFVGENPDILDLFEKLTGDKRASAWPCIFGGNVLNMMYILGTAYLDSSIFMAVGNDLSYDFDKDLEKRRQAYYADGDYSTNLGTKRDEAKRYIPWMGFELEESILVPGHYSIRFRPKSTTQQLLLYKIWMETRIGIQERHPRAFHYYNCTEGGILGVLSKTPDKREMFDDPDNWYLLDEIFPNRYHTTTLEKATKVFLQARMDLCRHTATRIVAQNVDRSAVRMVSADGAGLRLE